MAKIYDGVEKILKIFGILLFAAIGAAIAQSPTENRTYEKLYLYGREGGQEVLIGESKQYFDEMGRPTQSMTRLMGAEKVAASATLYDLRGRGVVQTIPTVFDGDLMYNTSLMLNAAGDPYGKADFDGDKLLNPSPVGQQPGTLGGYFSNANTDEPHVPLVRYPYSRTWTEPGPDPRKSVQAMPGNAYHMGSGREVHMETFPIMPTELAHYYALRQYFINATQIVNTSKGYKTVQTSPGNKKSAIYTDADGKQLASVVYDGSDPKYWSYTYYDDMGRVVAQVAPRGVITGSTAMPGHTTTYTYDTRNRLIAVESPDEGRSEFVYSRDGKLRFSQSQLQRNASPKRFSYSLYDGMGRAIESGEYTSGAFVFQSHSNDPNVPGSIRTIVDKNGAEGDLGTTGKQWVGKVAYDLPQADFPADALHPLQDFTVGQVAATENENSKTWYSYDELGRLTFQATRVHGLAKTFFIDYTYDFTGKLLEVAYQQGQAGESFHYHYSYDADQRLHQVHTSLAGTDPYLHATYHYYPHGPLKRVEIADQLQGIDYVYTAEGALKAINAVDTQYDPGHDGAPGATHADIMGIHYDYYPGDFERANTVSDLTPADLGSATYDGNIRAITWGRGDYKGPRPADETVVLETYQPSETVVTARKEVKLTGGFTVAYGQSFQAWIDPNATQPGTADNTKTYAYDYDSRSQLKTAKYGEDGTITATDKRNWVENINYDHNGNIITLKRYDDEGNLKHEFTYTLVAGKNQLQSVSGYATYTYDAIGRLASVVYDDTTLPAMYLAYDVASNVTGVYADAARTEAGLRVSFRYDDKGYRLMKKDHVQDIETWYIRDAAGNVLNYYHRIGASLVQGAHPIYGAGRLGMAFRYPDHLKYNYELADHQGNVRQVFTSLKYMAVATMETTEPHQSWEEGHSGFVNVAATRHTDQMWNTTPGGSKVAWLNPAVNGQAVGPAKELRVQKGDTVKMSVMAAYQIPTGSNTFLPAIGGLIAGSLGYTTVNSEGGRIYSAIEDATAGLAAVAADGNATVPKAYLQFLFFDNKLQYMPPVDGESYARVSTAAANTMHGSVNHEHLVLEYIVPEDGYMYIYVANESNNDVNVFFDDFTISQTGLHTVEATDYYPFGLVMSRYRTEKYGYGYQGQFAEEDEETGWNSFELRQYDPIIARWLSPDPYGQFSSPYLAMGNNPAMVDEDGGWSWVGFAVGAVAGGAIGYAASDGDWRWALAGAGLGGMLGGGLSIGKHAEGNSAWRSSDFSLSYDLPSINLPSIPIGIGDLSNLLPSLINSSNENRRIKLYGGYDINRAVLTLTSNAFPAYDENTCGKCATAIRKAIESGGLIIKDNPESAKDYGEYLKTLGFKQIESKGYSPLKGDIKVFQSYEGGSKHGHINMFNGNRWVSDFLENGDWPGPGYRINTPSYSIYRWNPHPNF